VTLPVVPGSSLSFAQINTELGYSSTAQVSLNDSAVRTLAGVGASPAQIAITNLSGKANTFPFTIASNTTNADLRTLALAAGWNGSAIPVATINSGVYVYSTSTGTPALTISGSFPAGVQLVNNGTILGCGGAGGTGANNGGTGSPGAGGGLALSVSVAVSITNNATISGGGGGGGGSGAYSNACGSTVGGGGGGGIGNGPAGSKGTVGSFTFTGSNGTAGTLTAPGVGVATSPWGHQGGTGGTGGAAGATGATGSSAYCGVGRAGGSGGSGGGAVSGNANITWVATGTRLGSIA